MARTEQEKTEARKRNKTAATILHETLTNFCRQLDDKDIECLDGELLEDLKALRTEMHEILNQLNPIIDEGIKSIAAQSVSGRLAPKV